MILEANSLVTVYIEILNFTRRYVDLSLSVNVGNLAARTTANCPTSEFYIKVV
jgi:hypothetical protein